jgi:hypothetical protein
MAGFKSETESGVRSSFSGLAKIAGLAFGGAALGSVIKSSIESAASSQVQGQAIRAEFGKAGEELIKFSKGAGEALNGTSAATEEAATRFGILFQNMGIGGKQAAEMTKRWEELGLSINKIRGGGITGAAQVLSELNTAASGASTRGLRELGISLSTAQVQAQGFRDGFSSSIKGALTPAQKAIATYQLATAQLPRDLALAQKHTGDFANVQAQLTIAWVNAKEALGKALLPEVTKLGQGIVKWAKAMEKSGALQRDFNTAAHIAATVIKAVVTAVTAAVHIYQALSHAVGGTKHVLELFLAAFAVAKFRSIGKAIQTDVGGALQRVKVRMAEARVEAAKTAATQKAGAASAGSAYKKSATEMSASTKSFGTTVKKEVTQSKAQLATVGTATKQIGTTMQVTSAETKTSFTKMGTAATQFGTTTKVQAAEAATAVKTAAVTSESSFAAAATGMKIAAIELGATIKFAIIQTGIGLIVVAVGIAVAYVITHWDQVKRYTVALGAAIAQVWRGLKEIIIGSVKVIGGGIVAYLIFPMKEFIDVAASATGWIPYFGDGVKKAAAAVDGLFNSMKNLATNGKDQIVKGAGDIGKVGTAWSDSLKKSADNPKTKKAAKDAGAKLGAQFTDSMAGAVGDGVTGSVKKVSDALQQTINTAHQAIATSVRNAKTNLDKIGQDLAKTITEIQSKLGGASGAIAGSPQGQAFAKLKKLIESGAPSFEIQRASAALSSQLQNVGKMQRSALQTELANLTASFDKGRIGYKMFESRLHKILSENGASLHTALKAGGPAFADAFKAQVSALGKQAQAIAALPAKYRGIGGAGGAADIRIIQPLEVIKTEQARIRAVAQKQAAQAHAAAQKAAAQAALLRSTGSREAVHAAVQRSTSLHESRRHTALLTKIAGGPLGPRGPIVERPRRRGAEGPEGPLGPIHAAIRDAIRQSKPARTSERGPAGPRGPIGDHGVEATRAGAARIKQAILTHQVASIRAVAAVGAKLTASERLILGAELRLVEPIGRLRAEQARIGAHAARQRDQLIRSSDRSNALLRRLEKANTKPPGFHKEPHGKGSQDARTGAKVGSRG